MRFPSEYLTSYGFTPTVESDGVEDYLVDHGWVAAIGGFVTSTMSVGNFDYEGITFANIAVAQTPVPAAVWLFGAGLLGTVVSSRKRLL